MPKTSSMTSNLPCSLATPKLCALNHWFDLRHITFFCFFLWMCMQFPCILMRSVWRKIARNKSVKCFRFIGIVFCHISASNHILFGTYRIFPPPLFAPLTLKHRIMTIDHGHTILCMIFFSVIPKQSKAVFMSAIATRTPFHSICVWLSLFHTVRTLFVYSWKFAFVDIVNRCEKSLSLISSLRAHITRS